MTTVTSRAKPNWTGNSGIEVVEEEVAVLVKAREKVPEPPPLFESPT